MEASKDTIAAIATPMGRGGIGIVRISGPAAHQILERVFIPRGGAEAMEPRRLAYGEVYDQEHQVALDQAMAVFMPAPHSFTTEDVVELQCHGGPQVMHAVLDLTLREGARLATPGEFTLRAFLNGRIDLAQAEAVCDLIEAKTPRAASLAARQLAGVLSKQVLGIEEGLLHVLSLITVAVDFPEDADAPSNGELIQLLDQQRLRIDELLHGAELGLSCREGVRTALLGSVNAGKSKLMNALLQRDRAIVTSVPGTTRDLLEEPLNIGGIPIILCDTAGLRPEEEADEVEKIGIKRSYIALEQAQLLLLVIDASLPLSGSERKLITETKGRRRLAVFNKADIASQDRINAHLAAAGGVPSIVISAKTGQGMDELRDAIRQQCGDELDAVAVSPLVNNLRHIEALREAQQHLEAAIAALDEDLPCDMAGIDIENACSALGKITGNSVSDEVLKEIFSRFCLGK